MIGRVEREVQREIDMLAAAERRPGLVASCLALARVMDNPRLMTIALSAARQLSAALDKLHAASVAPKGKLQVVSKMSKRD